jgi:hypothetical protein
VRASCGAGARRDCADGRRAAALAVKTMMSDAETAVGRDAPQLVVLTEAECASMMEEEGARIVERDGRYWEIDRGFCQPIHLLARFRGAEIRRPSRLCWGYRAALAEEDAHLANGSIPLHLLANARQFTEGRLVRLRRRDLRKCRDEVEFRRLRDPSLLLEQGWGVFSSAQLRAPFGRPLTREGYQRRVEQRAYDPRRIFVAGLIDGKLAGYMEAYAVDGVLYTHELFVATEFAQTGIATGLYVETMQVGVRAGTIREICYGLHLPERPGLQTFKDSLGCPLVQVPALVSIPAPARAYVKARRPLAYYRLTGGAPPAPEATHA